MKKVDEALAAQDRGDYEAAFLLLQEITQSSKVTSHFAQLGWTAFRLERWLDAEAALNKALELNPSFYLAMEMLGFVWAKRADKGESSQQFHIAKGWLQKRCQAKQNHAC